MLSVDTAEHTVTIDEYLAREMAEYVIEHSGRYGVNPFSEDNYDAHSYHDEPAMNPQCVHCAIYRYHRGSGHTAAMVQVAASILCNPRDAIPIDYTPGPASDPR